MKVVLLALTMVCTIYGFAQNFSGVVKDSQGTPLSGVKVEMPNDSKTTTTDVSGAWSIVASGSSSQILVFGKDGYTYEQIIDQSPASGIEISLRTQVNSFATVRENGYVSDNCASVDIPNNSDWDVSFAEINLKGDLAPDPVYTRRDPSAVIKVDDTCYVWYSYSESEMNDKQAPWDLNDLYYATSTDGITWTEKGAAIERGATGSNDARSAFTTEIFVYGGKYYLVYQAAADENGIYNRNTVCMAYADSPDGPWTKVAEPVLRPTYTDDYFFDNNAVHDPCIIYYNSKFYLYYKGECTNWCNPICGLSKQVKWGVAVADSPTGPYVKSEYNPITNTGHEVMAWSYSTGIAILQHKDGPEAGSIQYAADGKNFDIKGTVTGFPEAAGLYRADKSDTDQHAGVEWGLGHMLKWDNKTVAPLGWMHITRFDLINDSGLEINATSFLATGGIYDDGTVPFGVGKATNGINYVNSGDWVTYNVSIAESGIYEITYYTSTPSTNAEVTLYVDDTEVAKDNVVNSGAWDDYSKPTVSTTRIELTEGDYVFKLVASGSDDWQWNMQQMVLSKVGDIPTGLEKSEITQVTIYPNPANDFLYISGVKEDYIINLYSLDGRLQLSKQFDVDSGVDISSFDEGIYIVSIIKDGKSQITKIVIER